MSFFKAQQLYRMAEMACARRRGITLRMVMEEFAVEERTARRMMRQFEDLFPGVEIRDDPDRRRWWSLTDVPCIRHRALGRSEEEALDLAIRRATRDGATGEAKALGEVRDRMMAASRPPARGGQKCAETLLLAHGFACQPGPARRVPEAWLTLLFDAFRRQLRVRILYHGARQPDPEWRLVDPHAVILGMRYYLIAREPGADARFRQFRLDRIRQIGATDEPFARDPGFEVETYCAQAFGSFFSQAEQRPVRWRFAPAAAAAAREFLFHPTQRMTDLPDGGLLVDFTASGWVEMAWHLIQWGNHVEVLSPPELQTILARVRRGEMDVLP